MIRGDSSEYELLTKWCQTLPFFEDPKSVTTCEVGVREGMGSHLIINEIKSRIGKADYTHEMRDNMIKDFATNPHFKFYNMTDIQYMDLFYYAKKVYDLVFLDGPHTTKSILREALWFAERSRKGSRIIVDDYSLCNYSVIRAAISYWDFKDIDKGKHKVCFERI